MDPSGTLILPLAAETARQEQLAGGKAAKLAALAAAGHRIPAGFCITTAAYQRFLAHNRLTRPIDMELGRKSLATMRWEEIWDAALRIRTAFLRAPVPGDVAAAIIGAAAPWSAAPLAVRSSAVGEDSKDRSFAGLHESIVGVSGSEALLDAVRVVWASLWSDAALLYRKELELDPTRSVMAVVVQELLIRDRSGVAFGRDPRDAGLERQIVEAVPGLCRDLVDGAVDPDRWVLDRASGEVIEWRAGVREEEGAGAPLLEAQDLENLHHTLTALEEQFGWPPDIEWTGRAGDFVLLQARPVTRPQSLDPDEEKRAWYLSLRPGRARLADLCRRVTEELIPELEQTGRAFAAQSIDDLPDEQLAQALDARREAQARWKKIYWDEFIPFAHGVRQLGTYYNDTVKPDDPYEFIGLLRHQPMLATERSEALEELARALARQTVVASAVRRVLAETSAQPLGMTTLREQLREIPGGREFSVAFEKVLTRHLDIVYGGERLSNRPDLALHMVLELTERRGQTKETDAEPFDAVAPGAQGNIGAAGEGGTAGDSDATGDGGRAGTIDAAGGSGDLEARLLAAVGVERHEEARSVIEVARLSWRLRDDDNVLMGRLEHELLRAVKLAADRLAQASRLDPGAGVSGDDAAHLAGALRDPTGAAITLPARALQADSAKHTGQDAAETAGVSPRQLTGQPAAPGLATATARTVKGPEDLKVFRAGEVLICDAIQPTMSHVVPLAAAIVERRGGMLIHGAIIARELGIPCVNGVSEAVLSIASGEVVTVDGHLGIVTVGRPEFDLELAGEGPAPPTPPAAEEGRS